MNRSRLFALCSALAAGALGALPASAQQSEPDAATEAALNQSNVMTVRNIDRTELARGTQVYDATGKAVGTVGGLSGNDVIVTDAGHKYLVPITEFFAYNQYGKDYFAMRTPRSALVARAETAP